MKKFTVIHDNVKIHFDTEKEMKLYIENFGRGKIVAYETKVVFERTASHIKVDRL